jgi:hypothetical protein
LRFSFGIIVADPALKGWQLACVKRLTDSALGAFRCLVEFGSRPVSPSKNRYEQRLKRLKLPSLVATPLDEVCADFERVTRLKGELSDLDSLKDAVRSHQLDFLLDFSEDRYGCGFVDVSPYGVWAFVHSDLELFVSPAIGFWEIYYDHATTSAALVRLIRNDAGGVVLKQGHLATVHRSLGKNIEGICHLLVNWPALVCRDLEANCASYFNAAPCAQAPMDYDFPTGYELARVDIMTAADRMRRYIDSRLYLPDWEIARLVGTGAGYLGENLQGKVENIHPFQKGHFVADPFVFERDGKRYVFCEDYSYASNRGVISACEIGSTSYSPLRPVIEAPYHLSYPQVFEFDNTIYCLPEAVDQRKVQLYYATDFPYGWQAIGSPLLEDFAAVDSTLLQYGGSWWLFCTNLDEGYHSHLYVFYADQLLGKWQPHKKNPVKIDVRSAGPAGPSFLHGGSLYRPAQDCSRTYGGCININRIERLTNTEFCERVVGTIRPPRGSYGQGIHTISSAGDLWVVDVLRYVYNPRAPWAFFSDAAQATLLRLGFSQSTLHSFKRRVRGGRKL